MENLLQYVPSAINSLTVIVSICFFGGGLFHVSRRNSADIAELKTEQHRMNIGFQDLRLEVTKTAARLDLEISKIAGKLDMLIDRDTKR